VNENSKKISLISLFLLFVRTGAILLGGGYVILPILQRDFVQKGKLLTNDEMLDYFAIAQTMPGIVAANISMLTGYKIKGIAGALAGMFGIILVPFWIIVLLASVLGLLVTNNYVQGIFWGVGIAVIALIIITSYEIWENTKRDLFFYFIFLVALISLLIFDFSPVKTIITFSIVGVIYKKLRKRCKQ